MLKKPGEALANDRSRLGPGELGLPEIDKVIGHAIRNGVKAGDFLGTQDKISVSFVL